MLNIMSIIHHSEISLQGKVTLRGARKTKYYKFQPGGIPSISGFRASSSVVLLESGVQTFSRDISSPGTPRPCPRHRIHLSVVKKSWYICKHNTPKCPLNSDFSSIVLSEKCTFLISLVNEAFFPQPQRVLKMGVWEVGKCHEANITQSGVRIGWWRECGCECQACATRPRLNLSRPAFPHFEFRDHIQVSGGCKDHIR